jgi:hypothetical protein
MLVLYEPSFKFHLDFFNAFAGQLVVQIKFGPLMWTPSGVALEPSLDEVVRVVELAGFALCLSTSVGAWLRVYE